MANHEWTSRIQSSTKVGTVDVHWIPRYMSLAATSPGAVDMQYQIIGRSFVDTRYSKLPPDWKVNLLGARSTYHLVSLYSLLELRFAQMENVPLTSALAAIVQMITSPYAVRDDYTDWFMHDVVSMLAKQKMHVNERDSSVVHNLLKVPIPPKVKENAITPIGKNKSVWTESLPQHTPAANTLVVTLEHTPEEEE